MNSLAPHSPKPNYKDMLTDLPGMSFCGKNTRFFYNHVFDNIIVIIIIIIIMFKTENINTSFIELTKIRF